jgi:acyl phosphate:glycerol-3-phosphate acyltransferase
MITAAIIVFGYIAGSVPFGIVVGKGLFGVDPRDVGSGNIGAANSMRALGPLGAVLVLAGDVIKGAVPTALASHFLGYGKWGVAATGLATVVGHTWSIFLRFRGGKGVATGLGVLAVLSFPATLVFAVVWFATALITRYSSLASLLANVSVPISLWLLHAPRWYVAYGLVALGLIVWRHAGNIQRLAAGTELRIGTPKERNQQQ